MGALRFSVLALAALGCGGRSQLSLGEPVDPGGGGSGGEGGGDIVSVDPDVDCPLVCTLESCLPSVLLDDVPVGWHAIADGILYYTTAKPEGDNGLFRLGACGGAPQLLLSSEQFLGYGAVIGDEVFVTTAEPAETVRLPKTGGPPTLYHSDAGDVVTTRAIFDGAVGVILVRYHYDHSFGFYYFDEGGDFTSLITSLPDPDYDAAASDGFAFIPNLPAKDGYTGSAFGVYRPVSIPLSTIPVVGPLALDGDWLYFTGEPESGGLQHYKLKAGTEPSEVIPILGDDSGYILAVDSGTLFGATPYHAEHQGIVWHALPDDAAPSGILQSDEFVQNVVPAGQSLYVRTERRLVRVPKICPGDGPTPCIVLD